MIDEGKKIFENLERVAAVLVETLGRNCKVAIHDFANLPCSLVHVNGNVIKRTAGSPVTDPVVKALRREGDGAKDLCNYKNTTKHGRTLKSSTTFIRDEKGKVVGAFCINYDITDFLNAVALVEDFIQTGDTGEEETRETFPSPLNETIESLIGRIFRKAGKQPVTMSKAQKVALDGLLEIHGVFSIKGTVDHMAALLGVSKYTMYHYLKEVRSNRGMA